jgi:hypothetical protein
MDISEVTDWIGLSAAVGVASMGLVEALKWTPLGVVGLGRATEVLGKAAFSALQRAYGSQGFDAMLKGTFRRGHVALAETLRNGMRLGLDEENADKLATEFGVGAAPLTEAIKASRCGTSASDAAVAALARFQAAADVRAEAAAAAAHEKYLGMMRVTATLLAIVGSVTAAYLATEGFQSTEGFDWKTCGRAFVIGAVAVPIAPISKELVNFVRASAQALGARAR